VTEKQYDLYFSLINYRKYYYPDNNVRDVCELHGDYLRDDELIEVKWSNGVIEKVKIRIKVEITGIKSKRDVPYGVINYNNSETLICLENLLARRLYEPKKS
jgi:hypothetical protein